MALFHQQRAVAIAQEAKIVGQRIVVDGFPVALHEGRNQEQQCAFGLMEVGDNGLHHPELVARTYHYLRVGVQSGLLCAIEVVQDVL